MNRLQDFLESVFPLLETLEENALDEVKIILLNYKNDKNTIFMIRQVLYKFLWKKPKAIEIGFDDFLKKEINSKKEALLYHNENCNDCLICLNKIKVRDLLERTKSRIC